jgi:hypothetical protein
MTPWLHWTAVACSMLAAAAVVIVFVVTRPARSPVLIQGLPPVPSRYQFERETDVIAAWCRKGGQTFDTLRFTIVCKGV